MTAAKHPARVTFPTEQAMATWVLEHQTRLIAQMKRPELHAAWDANCLGMKEEGNRTRKVDLAFSVAFHDASLLGQDWWTAIVPAAELDASEARVRRVGTPTPWATEQAPAVVEARTAERQQAGQLRMDGGARALTLEDGFLLTASAAPSRRAVVRVEEPALF